MKKLKTALGATLRVISIFWIANGFAGIFLDFTLGLISMLLGFGLFRLGTWVKQKPKAE